MKTILIAGVSSGIGRAIAEKCLSKKYAIVGLARDNTKFNPISKNYQFYSIDFSEIDQLESQFKKIRKLHTHIDAIICCVGYGEFIELDQLSVKQMQHILQVNFLSQAILMKTFLSDFKKRKTGKYIVIGSECALSGYKKATLYCASKFALRGFTQALRQECAAAHVGVTLINPGLVDTPFFDKLNFMPAEGDSYAISADQIAKCVLHVLIENNNYVYEEINLQPMKRAVRKKVRHI